jgi:hypothetical protein
VLVLAMVAAWRFDRSDQLPNGLRAGRQLIDAFGRVRRIRRFSR